MLIELGGLLLRLTVGVIAGGAVLLAYRWIRARSTVLGTIVGAAILARIGLGLTLFAISYFELPVLRTLQVAGGFWAFALDATGYYQYAQQAIEQRDLWALDGSVPAPLYVNALAVWMALVGSSPAAGMFLNLMLYVGLAMLVVHRFAPVNEWRRDLPAIVALGGYSFAPVILLHSTQPLKDELTAATAGIACIGMFALAGIFHAASGPWRRILLGAVLIATAVFSASAIRYYYGFMIWSSVALTFVAFAVAGRTASFRPYATRAVAVLLAAWIAFAVGSGPYYPVVGASVAALVKWDPPRALTAAELRRSLAEGWSRVTAVPADLLRMTKLGRAGFQLSGGNTNVVIPIRDDSSKGLLTVRELEEQQRASAAYKARMAQMHRESAAAGQGERGGAAATPAAVVADGSAEVANAAPSAPAPASLEPRIVRQQQVVAFRAVATTPAEHVKAAVQGVLLLILPLSAFSLLWPIEIGSSRAFLSMVDIDTMFLNATTLAVLALGWTRRRLVREHAPVVIFALALSAITLVLLGYVVTNYGTVWRMRPLALVPLWTAVIALSPRREPAVLSAAPELRQPPASAESPLHHHA